MITGITAPHVPEVWPQVVGLISAACETSRGKFDAADIYQMLVNRDAQLWLVKESDVGGVIVTQIVNYPHRKVCWIRICTGHGREECFHHLKDIEAWAKEQGCGAMELIARPGWKKVLKDYECTHVVLEKDLL